VQAETPRLHAIGNGRFDRPDGAAPAHAGADADPDTNTDADT